MKATSLSKQKLPLFLPCYCRQCRSPLSHEGGMDDSHAWCSCCQSVVDTSPFHAPAWTIGTTALLFLILLIV